MSNDSEQSRKRATRFAGAKLKTLRQTIGLSRAVLGKELGISGQQIQKYEVGVNVLNIDRLYQLAGLFEVPPAVFFPVEDATHIQEPLPPASTRLIKMMNRISEEHHESLHAILHELLRIIQRSESAE